MLFQQKYKIQPHYLPCPSNRRRGWPMTPGVRFVVAHDTGNPGSTARQNVAYFRSSPRESASAHLFVDDGDIIECVPALTAAPEKAWHVLYTARVDHHLYGYSANDAAVGVEYCFGPLIDADEAYRRYIWVLAYVCSRFNLDPATAVTGHFILDPHRKTDPVTGLAHSRRTYDQLLRDVRSEYYACRGEPDPVALPVRLLAARCKVRTRVPLHIRGGSPDRRAPVVRTVPPGTLLEQVGLTHEGEPINGNPVWCKDADGNFFWSGAVSPE
jgi:hypothetical protein